MSNPMRDDKIDMINDMIPFLNSESRNTFAEIVYKYDKTLVKQCSDGVRIPANKLPEDLIDKLYYWIINKK
jgi:hypothetical protein